MKKTYCLIGLSFFLCAILIGGYGLYTAKKDGSEPRQNIAHAERAALEQRRTTENITVIKLTFEGKEAIAELYDHPTSRDFAAMLPLTLVFKDYNGTEKIADPPRALFAENIPKGFAPSAGDLTLFAPWGNLAIFYHDFHYSEGLVPIGRFTSGIEDLAKMEKEFRVHIERIP